MFQWACCLALAGLWLCAAPLHVAGQTQASSPPPASGQAATSGQAAANPLTGGLTRLAAFIKGNIIKSAERMAEENYAFRPTPDVRSFGAILGHIADSNYQFCSQGAGSDNPSKVQIEKTVTSKADLVAALQESFAYCDRVLGGLNDRSGSEIVKSPLGELAKLSVLTVSTAHNFEHYGNIITYMRMKGLVPPSSDPTR